MAYADILKERTENFGVDIVHLCRKLPKTDEARIIGRQLIRSGTSVGANYWSACRGRSKPDFISKLGIVLEEADETLYWLHLLTKTGILPDSTVDPLLQEGRELTAIFVASLRTAKGDQH